MGYGGKLNPEYDSKELGWESVGLDEPDRCYEFNELRFWRTTKGLVVSACDAGCSCPTPFENYSGENEDAIIPLLERVGSIEQAERIVDAWNKGYDGRPLVDHGERAKVLDVVRGWLQAAG